MGWPTLDLAPSFGWLLAVAAAEVGLVAVLLVCASGRVGLPGRELWGMSYPPRLPSARDQRDTAL